MTHICAAPASAQTAGSSRLTGPVGDTKPSAEALRTGGYVLLVRHGATFSGRADTDPFNLANVAKQRNP
jgi:hypothetical protein